jgi:hypothetical protein
MLQVLQPGPRSRTNSTEKSEAQSNPSGIQIAARRDFSEDSMKSAFLLMVVPALLAALGFAQVPAASSNSGNPDQVNIKGCLGGSDGNYTVAQDDTGKTFKITTSSADLKAYVGQDVNLTGSKASASESSIAVTGLSMISEHCIAATAAPAPIVSAPAASASATPSAAVPAAAPASIVSLPPAVATPAAAPDATVSGPAKTADAVHRTRPSARPRKPAETLAAAAAPAEPVTSTPVADAAAISPTVGPPPATASTPAAPVTKASTSRSAGMLAVIVVVLLLVGTGVPVYNRWRKRKLLEQTEGQNLSFTKESKSTNEAKSDSDKTDTTGGRKAA